MNLKFLRIKENSFVIILFFTLISYGLYSQKSENKECFTADNFQLSLKYVDWKKKTSKIGKVLVDNYEVEINENQEIVFKDNKGYSIFKVNKEKGIILLPIKQKKNLINKANKAFCELIKYASISGNNYK